MTFQPTDDDPLLRVPLTERPWPYGHPRARRPSAKYDQHWEQAVRDYRNPRRLLNRYVVSVVGATALMAVLFHVPDAIVPIGVFWSVVALPTTYGPYWSIRKFERERFSN